MDDLGRENVESPERRRQQQDEGPEVDHHDPGRAGPQREAELGPRMAEEEGAASAGPMSRRTSFEPSEATPRLDGGRGPPEAVPFSPNGRYAAADSVQACVHSE